MILDEIVMMKIKSLENAKRKISLESMKNKAYEIAEREKTKVTESFLDVLKNRNFSIIGEFKKASPSKGVIKKEFLVKEIANVYKEIGVPLFSILTEEDYFLGNDKYIEEVIKIDNKPILRKDFTVDIYQVYETKVLGAKGILLIVAVLKDRLQEFYNEAVKLLLTPLVEVHNEEELEIAINCGCKVIGINNRDLKTFKVDIETTTRLIKAIPKDVIIVSESGISSIEDIKYLKSLGVNALLIGELFMRNLENEEFLNKVNKILQI